MPRPRVVHLTTVHHALDPRIFWKECVSLQQGGYDVALVAQHAQRETRTGVDIVPLPMARGRYRRAALQRPAYRAARALGAALYHVHDPEVLPVAFALKRATGARIVYDMHENNFVQRGAERALARRLERWAFGWVDHVVLAEASYEAVLPEATPRTIILNYFRPFQQTEPRVPERAGPGLRLLYAGVQAHDRGLSLLLDLMTHARTRRRRWHLTLAGIGYRAADRAAAEARLRAEHLEDAVRRIGWEAYVPWPALEPHFAEAHVGLALLNPLPNFTGSVPTKFYEYLFFGLPLLCTDVPLWRSFVEQHGCGAVVPPGDAEAAADVLAAWDDDPARYRRLAEAAAAAAPQFLWSAMERRLLALYERLLGG